MNSSRHHNSQGADAPVRHLREGLAAHEQGRLADARSIYEAVLREEPTNFDALHLLGVLEYHCGNSSAALDLIDRAISVDANHPGCHMHRGLVLQQLGLFDDAFSSFDRSISLKSDFADAYVNRGNLHSELCQHEAAIASFDMALRLKPDLGAAWFNLANSLLKIDRVADAVGAFDKAISLKPDYAEAFHNRGVALRTLGNSDAAIASFDNAIRFGPDRAEAHYQRGIALAEVNLLECAVTSFDRAIAITPTHAEACRGRAIVLQDLKRTDAALASFERALALNPDFDFVLGHLLHLKTQLCDWSGIEELLQRYEASILTGQRVTVPFAALALLDDPAAHRRAAEIYAHATLAPEPAIPEIAPVRREGPIRIGYYSADFYNHATAYLMAQLFELHDREQFEIYGFSFGPVQHDEMRARVSSAFDRFFDVAGRHSTEIAALSRQLEIDIAVDLKGFTQNCRTSMFAKRCAPVQVNYLGYPGTMGVDFIDYIIADATVIPDEYREHYAEKVVSLPHSYQVNDSTRRISDRVFTRSELGLPETGFVFCCFNHSYKILPATFQGWMRILKSVEGSVLWLMEYHPTATANLRRSAEAAGVDGKRLVFARHMKLDEHLARHRLADLFLDTLPYSAHTTASDALWAGLPVLTLMGRSFAARVAASLLNAVNLSDLVTHTQQQYEALAIELAHNPGRLSSLRRSLEDGIRTSPLFDTRAFVVNIEAAYQEMHSRRLAGLPPSHICVPTES